MKTQSMTRSLGACMLLALGVSIAPPQAQATPFIGEMRWVAFNFAPKGWATCDGQLLPINQNQALFSLLGTSYGGNGQTTFALPDMRSRAPVHVSATLALGMRSGAESHTLTLAEVPAHSHALKADPQEATAASPASTLYLAKTSTGTSAYGLTPGGVELASEALTTAGGSQPHENMKPFIALNCVIALQGIFPSRN